jgi:hypothetical protein
MYEKKLNILQIPHIILWKLMNESSQLQYTLVGQDALRFFQTQKNFLFLATGYLI